MMHAILSGLSSAFSSTGAPAYLSALFATSPDAHTGPLRPFPADGPFLSAQEVATLQQSAPHRWTSARCEAHLDVSHPLARRASVSWFVWQHYVSRPQMTLAELRDWVELDLLNKALTPQSWAQHRAAAAGQPLDTWWTQYTQQHNGALVARHAATMKRLQAYR